jgi:hypothetical protein
MTHDPLSGHMQARCTYHPISRAALTAIEYTKVRKQEEFRNEFPLLDVSWLIPNDAWHGERAVLHTLAPW